MPRTSPWARLEAAVARTLPGECGFLIADAASVVLVGAVARQLWYATRFPPAAWALGGAAWLLGWFASATAHSRRPVPGWRQRPRWLPPAVASLACAPALKLLADPLTWRQASAVALMAWIASACSRLALGLIRRRRFVGAGEGLRFAAAQAAAVFAVHPYLHSGLLGAGDASSYSLMVADFRAQWHAGVFPVLIGQGAQAFNGGFQPIRNAPYLQHLSGVIDVLTLGTLNAFALLNLTVLASMLGAVVGCYAALRIFVPKAPWAALGFAVLFGLCPGVLAPLYGGDMYPTFMTLPFLPWLVLGIAESTALPAKQWPWAVQAVALAAIWNGHPPVAAWATLLAVFSGVWTLLREHRWVVAGRQAAAFVLFLALNAYLFVSVYTLHLPAVSRASALETITFKLSVLRDNWRGSFLPVSSHDAQLLSDIQLGYGLWLCVAFALAGALRRRTGRKLLGCFALLLVFTWPIPGLTQLAWSSLPTELLVVTNQWPEERFYVLLAALAVFLAAAEIRDQRIRLPWRRRAAGAVLVTACLWSAAEARQFFARGADIRQTEAQAGDTHLPEGVVLSRTHSNEYLGVPSTFSYGHMDPRLQLRLLDRQTHEAFADGASLRTGTAAPASRTLTWTESADGSLGEALPLAPGEPLVLRFDFLGAHPEGEFQLRGEHYYNFYALPQSGLPRAFGTEAGNARSLVLENNTGEPEEIRPVFLRAGGNSPGTPFAQVVVEPLAKAVRAIRLDSLIPLEVHVSAPRDSYLETPRLFLPGYRAIVDGRPALSERSPEGLVAIPLSQGEHAVRLEYYGGALLRLSFFSSAAAWLFLALYTGRRALLNRDRPRPGSGGAAARLTALSRRLVPPPAVLVGIGVGAAIVTGGLVAWREVQEHSPAAGYRMVIKLPFGPAGTTEPLLTSGHNGAGDFIYVTYVDGTHVVVGHDKWGYGGAKSVPFLVDPDLAQTIEIDLGAGVPGHVPARPLVVRWNGVESFTDPLLFYPAQAAEVSYGTNLIGGSSAGLRFTGEILESGRWRPSGT